MSLKATELTSSKSIVLAYQDSIEKLTKDHSVGQTDAPP